MLIIQWNIPYSHTQIKYVHAFLIDKYIYKKSFRAFYFLSVADHNKK